MAKVKFEEQKAIENGHPAFIVKVDDKKMGILKSDESNIWELNIFYTYDEPSKIGEVIDYYDDFDERAYLLDEVKDKIVYDYGRTEEEYEEDARIQAKIEKQLEWLLN